MGVAPSRELSHRGNSAKRIFPYVAVGAVGPLRVTVGLLMLPRVTGGADADFRPCVTAGADF